ENTKYFYWVTPEGQGKGYLGEKNDEKKFFLEINSRVLGEIKALLSWKMPELEDLKIWFWFKEEKAYLVSIKFREELEKMLSEEMIYPENLSFQLKSSEIRGEWQA
ncbi:MAG: hypothetical protein KDK36_05620, partial [Leptospiraceae bacterium]|nr:hypothetical protein [Leptospiraceae bacterium]